MPRILFRKFLVALFLIFITPSLSKALVRISNMNDFNFGTWSGTGNLTASDNVCIYDSVNNNYRIRGSGSGTGGAFTLANGANTLPYSVTFQGTVGGAVALTANVQTAAIRAANTTSSTCAGGTNATISITITAANMLTVDAGTYTGVLTILLRP